MRAGWSHAFESVDELFELPGDIAAGIDTAATHARLDASPKRSRIFLIRVLCRVFGFKWAWLGFIKLSFALLNYVPPLMLKGIVEYLQEVDDPARTEPVANPNRAFYYAGGMMSVTLIIGVLQVHYRYRITRLSVSLRGAIMDVVYGKLLRIRSSDLSQSMDSGQASARRGRWFCFCFFLFLRG